MDNSNESQTLFIDSEHLHERMNTLNIRQVDLAKHLGVSESTISKWTNSPTDRSSSKRTITPKMLESLCLYLDCVPDYLLGRSDSPYTTSTGEALAVTFPQYNKALNELIDHLRKANSSKYFDYTMIQCLNYYFSSMNETDRQTCRQMFKAFCFHDQYRSWYLKDKFNPNQQSST